MIRSILVIKFKPEATEAQIVAFAEALAAIPFEGRRSFEFHRSARLAADPGDAMDALTISDFDDEAAYEAWLADADHHRVRSEFLDPIRERRDRFLYEV
jgi:heme-degrading monooxygenase HmoA